jgi:hypothetical protein
VSDPPDRKDLDVERDWLAKAWHEYAKEFGVFVLNSSPLSRYGSLSYLYPRKKGDSIRGCSSTATGYSSPKWSDLVFPHLPVM